MPDHIHIFISAPQTIAPTEIVKILKSFSEVVVLAVGCTAILSNNDGDIPKTESTVAENETEQ